MAHPVLGWASMTVSAAGTSTTTLTRVGDHPRLLEVVVGRLLEIVVYSVEGARDLLRGRGPVH